MDEDVCKIAERTESTEQEPNEPEERAELAEQELNEAEERIELTEQELNETLEQLCVSKADEFRMLGYEHVTAAEVWQCVSDKYAKHGTPPLYQKVNDILSLKVTTFMNWLTMGIYRNDARF